MIWIDYSGIKYEADLDDSGVLVVDDDIDYLELLRLFVKVEGFGVTGTTSAEDALALLKVSRFSIMLIDYNMFGKDGLKLAEAALRISTDLKIIMITENNSTQLHNRAAASGIMALLVKPLDFNELSKIMHSEKNRRIADGMPISLVAGSLR